MIFRYNLSVIFYIALLCICSKEQGRMLHVSALQASLPKGTRFAPRTNMGRLKSSSDDEETPVDYDQEETLMQIHLLSDDTKEIAIQEISKYTQQFPFSAILPVQPLQYLPSPDGGVEVTFLRKKTKEKGSMDGGIRFFITEERNGYDVIAKRNSKGQTISKAFSEKLIIQAFVKGISGEEIEKTGLPPTNVSVESVFHMWL